MENKSSGLRSQVNSELLQGKKMLINGNSQQQKQYKRLQYASESENQVKKIYVSNDVPTLQSEKEEFLAIQLKPQQPIEKGAKPPFPQSGSFFLRNNQLKNADGTPATIADLEQQLLKKHFDEFQKQKREQKSELQVSSYVNGTPNVFQVGEITNKSVMNGLSPNGLIQTQDNDNLKALITQLEKNKLPKLPNQESNQNTIDYSKGLQQNKTLQISSYRYGKELVSSKNLSAKKQKVKDRSQTKSGQVLPSFLIGSSIKSQDNPLISLQNTIIENCIEKEVKRNMNDQKLGNVNSYQLSPKLSKNTRESPKKKSHSNQPKQNAFKKLIEQNQNLLDKFPLPYEAKYILESNEPIDVLTIELSDFDYGSLKDPLGNVFGNQIFSLIESPPKSYFLEQLNSQIIDPINIMSLQMKKEDNEIMKEKYNSLFEWCENKTNIKVIIKHTEMYTILKKKYNYHKKHNPELNQFIATRDLSILLFMIYLGEEKLIQNPASILSSVNNLIIVINPQIPKKEEDEPYVAKKYYVQGMQLSKKIEPVIPTTPTSKKAISKSLIKDPSNSERKHHRVEDQPNKQFQKTVPKFLSPVKKSVTKQSLQPVLKNSETAVTENNSAKKRTRSPMPRQSSESQLNQDKEGNKNLPESPKKIKVLQQNYTHLKNSKINEAFRNYNTFISLTFKNKEREIDQKKIIQLSKLMGINIQAKFQITEQYFRNKETAFPLKEKLFFYFLNTIRNENSLPNENQNSNNNQGDEQIQFSVSQSYKCSIGQGNNALMIRNIMKQRWWWNQLSEKADFKEANFIWTQWRQKKLVSQLKTYKELHQSPQQSALQEQIKADSDSYNNGSTTDTSLSSINQKLGKCRSKKQISNNEIPLESQQNTVNFPQNRMYGKIEENFHLSNKKALFYNMKNYYEAIGEDLTNCLPLTFHIKGKEDPEYNRFIDNFAKFKKLSKSNEAIWIIKPGENTNRGHGIEVKKNLKEIMSTCESFFYQERTVILQKYIHNPLLIHKRKFDIRCFALVTTVNGVMKGYFYQEGYLRTSSKEFNLNNLGNRLIHLTNDAIQKHCDDYGKYEAGNKMSYDEFQKYLDQNIENYKVNFKKELLPQVEKLITDTIRGTYLKLDPKRRVNSFEIFGYDFMIDDEFKVYLIEANTNPCLELSSPLLAKLIPRMVDNAFRIALDPVFLPPDNFSFKKAQVSEIAYENKFTLIFDEKIDGPSLSEILKDKNKIMFEIDEEEEERDEDDDDNYE